MNYSNKVSQRGNPFGVGFTCSQLLDSMSKKPRNPWEVKE
jgi:hypothetical protein